MNEIVVIGAIFPIPLSTHFYLYRLTEGKMTAIATIRAPAERPFAVIKSVFKAAHVLVTTVGRVHIKMIFTAIAYNWYQLRTLRKASVI